MLLICRPFVSFSRLSYPTESQQQAENAADITKNPNRLKLIFFKEAQDLYELTLTFRK